MPAILLVPPIFLDDGASLKNNVPTYVVFDLFKSTVDFSSTCTVPCCCFTQDTPQWKSNLEKLAKYFNTGKNRACFN